MMPTAMWKIPERFLPQMCYVQAPAWLFSHFTLGPTQDITILLAIGPGYTNSFQQFSNKNDVFFYKMPFKKQWTSHGCAFRSLISILLFLRKKKWGDDILPWSYELWSLPTFCVQAGGGWIGCWLTTTSPRWCNTSCPSTLAWNRSGIYRNLSKSTWTLKPSNLLKTVIGHNKEWVV